MKMGLELKAEQKQTLVMTPAIIQAIRILGLSKAELDEYVDEEISVNPVLEINHEYSPEKNEKEELGEEPNDDRVKRDKRADDFDWAQYIEEREYNDASYNYSNSSQSVSNTLNDISFDVPDKYDNTLLAYLIEQLSTLNFSKTLDNVRHVGEVSLYIIETLDENGFLTESDEEISLSTGADISLVKDVIKEIQKFDPPGICARNLEESLLIQLDFLNNQDEGVRKIIKNHLADVATNKIALIAKQTGLKKKQVLDAIDLIKTLEPKPGRGFADGEDTKYIIPDVIIEKSNDGFVVSRSTSGIPRLMISSYYNDVLDSSKKDKDDEAYVFLSERLNSAVQLIKSLEQREQTIYNVTSAILKYQEAFFEKGQKYLKSLTLKKIGSELGIHESTVSRTIKGKYVQTPVGIFELKYFFDSGVTDSFGEGVASSSVKTRIEEMISNEDKRKPLADEAIVRLLAEEKIIISRRTVAKYRDEMGVASSSRRKNRR